MKEVTMEYEVSLLNAGDVIQALQNGMSMVLNHDRALVEYIKNPDDEWAEGYKLCLHYLGIIK